MRGIHWWLKWCQINTSSICFEHLNVFEYICSNTLGVTNSSNVPQCSKSIGQMVLRRRPFDLCVYGGWHFTWWRHQMETFSALLAICAGNSPVPGEFPTQRPVTRSFDVYFDLRPNKWLSKQWCGWWFETISCSLWRHRNEHSISLAQSSCTIPIKQSFHSFSVPFYKIGTAVFHNELTQNVSVEEMCFQSFPLTTV